jgi:hypothetical protein
MIGGVCSDYMQARPIVDLVAQIILYGLSAILMIYSATYVMSTLVSSKHRWNTKRHYERYDNEGRLYMWAIDQMAENSRLKAKNYEPGFLALAIETIKNKTCFRIEFK